MLDCIGKEDDTCVNLRTISSAGGTLLLETISRATRCLNDWLIYGVSLFNTCCDDIVLLELAGHAFSCASNST